MKLLDDAIERVRPFVVERLDQSDSMNTTKDNTYRGPDSHGYFCCGVKDGSVARMRLDWELDFSDSFSLSNKEIAERMLNVFKADLEELIEDGDINKTTDPLLNTFDGSKKRGQTPVEVDIFGFSLYWEHKERKQTTEYTAYLLMYVKWE